MNPFSAILLFLAGVAAGFINVNAGGGSFLTIPLLILLGGLSPTAANGTNRIAILLQNLFAMKNFRNHGFRDLRQGVKLGLSAVVGAVIGSTVALEIPDDVFRIILSGVMLMALVIIFKPAGKKDVDHAGEELRHPRLQVLMFFLIGIYGGFIQAGTGYLVIFALSVVGGLSLVKTNSLKIIVIAFYMLPSLAVFVIGGEVRWVPGLILAAGTSLGGWTGTAFAVRKGDRWIKLILAAAITAMALKMMGLF
ncbi:MAG: sulfite exporter TauE/SafE family protein [Candidatus Fermentibacteraceae bacterium]|nr:sulfite exporter TauE/SafE family protein [Candidatus Fermentibacteraceae bacterium]MBN2607579.1 sulfite exporter TauE/SafE family protein [Candidatus Fermentibacteraceae bacterium]